MEWFYAKDGERLGPYSESTLEQRLASGEITGDTLVWRRGMEDWAELRTVRSESPAGNPVFNAPAVDPGVVCVECERRFPETEVVRIGGRATCAGCKPTVLQKLQEGLLVSGDGQAWRSGKRVVVTLKGTLPNRCVVCNRPAEGEPSRLKVSWAPSFGSYFMVVIVIVVSLVLVSWRTAPMWLPAFLIILGAVFSVAVSLIFGRSIEVTFGYCSSHGRRVAVLSTVSVVASVCGLILLFVGQGFGLFRILGICLLASNWVLALSGGRTLSVAKANPRFVWLKGARRPFLDSLPEWKEP